MYSCSECAKHEDDRCDNNGLIPRVRCFVKREEDAMREEYESAERYSATKDERNVDVHR